MTSEPDENFAWTVELWLIMNHNRESGTGIMKDLIDVIYPSEHERQSIHSHPHTLISTTIYSQNCTLLFHSFVTTSIKSSGIQKTMNGLLLTPTHWLWLQVIGEIENCESYVGGDGGKIEWLILSGWRVLLTERLMDRHW